MMQYSQTVKEEFEDDQLSEFLELMDECGKEVEVVDGEYYVRTSGGRVLAYFSEVPSDGPAGGWAHFSHFEDCALRGVGA